MKTNTIYNESCISTMAKMPSEFIDLVVTSPPYYNAKDYISYNSVEEYMEQMIEIFSEVYDKMKEGRMCVINISPVLVKI
jgi:DNA modification methylase